MADAEGTRGKKRANSADAQQVSNMDQGPAKKQAKTVFSLQDRIKLIHNIQEHAPKTDKHSYKVCISKLDWSKVCFPDFPSDVCQKEWDVIQNEIRKYRTMAEVTADALQVVQNPFSHRKLVHPDHPKQPLTPFFMFYSEKAKKFKKKHPEMPQYEISRSLALKFKELPEHKKAKYNQKYGDQRLMYQKELATFLAEHPEYKKDGRHGGGGPKPPKLLNPYQLWANKRFEALQREDNEVTRGQMDTQLREEWKAMPDKKRVKWINKALEEQIKYLKDVEEYLEQNPNFKIPEIKKPLLTKKELKLKEGMDGKPNKPPANAYNLFCSEMLKQMGHMGSNTRAKMMECSALWSDTDTKKKQDYKERVEKLKVQYKKDLEKYIEGLPAVEREKYKPELEAMARQAKKSPKSTNSSSSRLKPKKPVSALFLYTQEQRKAFKNENPDMSDTEVTRNLARKFSELTDKQKEKYRRKAQEARKEQEDDSDDDDDDDDDEDDDEESNKTGVGMYTSHHLSAYMAEHEMKKSAAIARLKEAWEKLKKSEKTPWVQKAAEGNRQAKRKHLDRQLLKGEPDKPLNSGYRIFTAEHMRTDEIKALPSTERIKAVASKWRDLSAYGKKRYEAKKEKLIKDYKKEIDKYRKSLSKEDRDRYDELKKAGLSKYSREVTKKKPPVKRKKKVAASDEEEEEEDSEEEESDEEESDDDSSSASSGSGSEANSSDAASGSDDDDEEEEEDGDEDEASSSASSSSSSASSGSSSSEEEEEEEEDETKGKGAKGKQKGKEKIVIKEEPKENGEKEDSGSSSDSESSSSEASSEEEESD